MTGELERELGEARARIVRLEDEKRRLEDRLRHQPPDDDLRLALDAAALVGTWDWDVLNDRVHADGRFAALYGLDPAEGSRGLSLAQFVEGVHPDDREALALAIRRALEDGEVFAHHYRTRNREGETRWVFARGRAFRDEDGRPVRFPGAVVDVTNERRRAERQDALLRLGDAAADLDRSTPFTGRALAILGETLEIARVGYATVDPDQRHATIVEQWCAPGLELIGGRVEVSHFGEDLLQALRQGVVRVEDVEGHELTRGSVASWRQIGIRSVLNLAVVREGRVDVILFLHAAEPRRWPDEEVSFVREVLNRAWTTSRRHDAELSLIDAERKLRLACEVADLGVFELDLETGALRWDRRCREIYGVDPDAVIRFPQTVVDLVHPEDRPGFLAAIQPVVDGSGPSSFEESFRVIGPSDGALRHVHSTGQIMRNSRGERSLMGLVRDVSHDREAEGRQRLLSRELQHRVKNSLAMVRALASQTMRRAATPAEGFAHFSARLEALSQAHDILTATSWTGAPIRDVVTGSLLSHETGGADAPRIRFDGPAIALDARRSLALSLALHELATNAAKYGALSNDDGHVELCWWIEAEDTAPCFRFEWRESGGPQVAEPTARGFGSRLIEQSLASDFDGTVEMRFEPGGLVVRVEAPLPGADPSAQVVMSTTPASPLSAP